MNVDNEYISLPDDPEEAFAFLHLREYAKLEQYWSENRDGGNFFTRQYVDKLLAFDEVYGLNFFVDFPRPPAEERKFYEFFEAFRRHAEITSQKILMEAARRQKVGAEPIVVLDEHVRRAVHHLLNQIREKLNSISIPDDKREALFNKLNAFASELDRNRTRTAAFLAFAVDTSRAARETHDNLKPLQNTVDKILDYLDKAKKWHESLPPWSDRKKIDGPPKQLPKPSGLDDEIPF